MSVASVLFDLDGTLIDTAPDMAEALQKLVAHYQRPMLSFADIRPFVSHGATTLVKLGFPQESPETYQRLREEYLEIYADNLANNSALFPGMDDLLSYLEAHNILWGVVTNKPAFLTNPLLDALDLAKRSACIVSGDTTDQHKPHPKPLLYACEQIKVSPTDSIYLGDAERDVQSAKAAGMTMLVALFGYINQEEDPSCWGADGLLTHIDELYQWL